MKTQFINILYGNGTNNAIKQNSSLWFLPALFSIQIFYFLIIKYFKEIKIDEKVVIFLLLIIGYISNEYFSFNLPWKINTCLNIGFFFYLGYLLKSKGVFENTEPKKQIISIISLFIIGVMSCFLNKSDVSYINYSYGYYTLALLSGLCLSIVTIFLSKIISENKVMEYIGKNTMGILIFHKIVILIFQTKMKAISELLIDSNFIIELLLCILVAIMSIVCSLIATSITRKIYPPLIGELTKN